MSAIAGTVAPTVQGSQRNKIPTNGLFHSFASPSVPGKSDTSVFPLPVTVFSHQKQSSCPREFVNPNVASRAPGVER